MSPPYFSRHDENAGTPLQVPVALPVNCACENHTRVCKFANLTFVLWLIRIASDDHQRPISLELTVSFQDQFEIVFRLEAPNRQNLLPLGKF